MQRYGQAGRKEEHGPDWGLLLAASREVSGPTFKFSSDPSSPRPAAGCTGQTRPRKEEGTELAWNWIYFLAAASGPPLVVYISLPASDRNSIFPSLPFLFFYPSPLHSSKNFSIFDQSDIKMSPNDNVKVLGMPVSTQCLHPSIPKKNSLAPTAEATNIASFATPSAIDSILDSTANPSWLMPSFSLRWLCAWFLPFGTVCGLSRCSKNSSLLPCESPKQVKAQSLTTIIATALRGGLPEYVSSTISMPRHRHRHGSVHRGASLAGTRSVAVIPGQASFHSSGNPSP